MMRFSQRLWYTSLSNSNDTKMEKRGISGVLLKISVAYFCGWDGSRPVITFSKLTIETLEQGVKYLQR